MSSRWVGSCLLIVASVHCAGDGQERLGMTTDPSFDAGDAAAPPVWHCFVERALDGSFCQCTTDAVGTDALASYSSSCPTEYPCCGHFYSGDRCVCRDLPEDQCRQQLLEVAIRVDVCPTPEVLEPYR